ncbi:spore-associated protein A [Kitasatospora sp. CB02891]|uniref:spore-associated protein A n=1 Tax=Kitasatospora sp. CB02891 TaxID=2020329 RepID=UPI000C2745C3|nr:spore-associated protein A [Kitasatospora sp. CB02891]PJN29926.1 spore-associated protein A [Kitasatospora sp. CB02891]
MIRGTKTAKRIAAGAAVLATASAGLLAAPTTAQAASYNGACGSGYSVIDSLSVSGGTVFLTYNSGNGQNCVVTVRNSSGSAVFVDAGIKISGSSTWIHDGGNYTTYAGPVRVYAPGQCIDWYGTIASTAVQYNSHCG